MPTTNLTTDEIEAEEKKIGKYCKNITLDIENDVSSINVETYQNQITRLIFKTTQGQALVAGTYIRNNVK